MPWRSRNYAPAVRLLRLGLVVVPAMVALLWAWQSWNASRSAAVKTSQQNAALLSEYVLRIFQSQKLLLNQVDRIIAEDPGIGAEALHRKLRALDIGYEFTTSLGVIGADGTLRAGSRTYPLVANYSHRDYFVALRDRSDIPLFIDRITLQPVTRDTLTVVRRLSGNHFQGLATASTDVTQFTDFLTRISTPDSAAFLLRGDGKLLVRPNQNDPPARMRPDGPVMTAIAQSDNGIFDAPGYMDGISRTYAYQKIGDLPLYAIHGVSRAALLTGMAADMVPILLFLVMSATLGHIALTNMVKRVEAERAQRETEFDRKLLEEAQQVAAYKETLLKEMNHRIHNNLQVVQSLISMKSRNPGDPVATLDEIGKRVWAISEVHNLLYNASKYSHIDLGAFLRTMTNNPGIVPPERGIAVICEAEKVEVKIDHAVPASLIVLELLTNALKHAFPGERVGSVRITLQQIGNEVEIIVTDDGIGLPDTRSRHSGLRLLQVLAEQIGGCIETGAGPHGGTRIRLTFPLAPDERGPDRQVAEPRHAAIQPAAG